MGKIKKKSAKVSNTVIQPSTNETTDDLEDKTIRYDEFIRKGREIQKEMKELDDRLRDYVENYKYRKTDEEREIEKHIKMAKDFSDNGSLIVADESDMTESDFEISPDPSSDEEDEQQSNSYDIEFPKEEDFIMEPVDNDVVVRYGKLQKKRCFNLKQVNTRMITVEFECEEGKEDNLKEDITKIFENFGHTKTLTVLSKHAMSDEQKWSSSSGLMTYIIIIDYISPIAARRAFSMDGRLWRNKYPFHIKYTEQFLQPFFFLDTAKCLYLSNLVKEIDNNTIHKIFSTCGVIEYVYIMRDQLGVSKGNGWVTFMMQEAAQNATKLNGTVILGRPVLVMACQSSGFFDTDNPLEMDSEPEIESEQPEEQPEKQPEQTSEEELEEPKTKKMKVSAKSKARKVKKANFKQKKNKKLQKKSK